MNSDRRLIIFRSRLREGVEAAYAKRVEEVAVFANKTKGLVATKDFVAQDGERLAVIEFDTAEHLAEWRNHEQHQQAQHEGRDRWYQTYDIQICSVVRETHFDVRDAKPRRVDADPEHLRRIALRWLQCFADRDLETLLSLYIEDAVHTSPKIRVLHPDTGGVLRGKAALRAWWGAAFARLSGLRYDLKALTADTHRVFIEYIRRVPDEADLPVAESLDIENGMIVASQVFHG